MKRRRTFITRRAVRSVEQRRKSRQRKPSKPLKRQQPERKEKHRNGQRRANRKQHYKLSKPSARHDMRNANATSVTYFPPLPAWSNGASGGN